MKIENLIKQAKAHNEAIENFINVTLKEHFGSETISVNQWFEAQRLINEQDFYSKGIAIVTKLRNEGIDAKLNMQSNRICLPYKYN